MVLESACIPVPSEAIMLFAGFNVSEGDMTLFGIVAAGVLGNMVGSWIAYAVGYYGRLELLEQNRLIHVSQKHLAWADRWFARYGDWAVFFTRMLPIIRTFISLPAGVARMPFWRFTLFTAAGCIPWVLMLAIIGREVGDNWEEWRDHLHYLDYVVLVAIVAGIVYLLIRRRGDRGGGEPEPSSEPVGSSQRRLIRACEVVAASQAIPLRRAALLGLVQGPAELLPISSSAHLVLIPWLAGWDWDALDPEVRKSFEVALHAGAAAALLIGQRRVIASELRGLRPPPRRACSRSPSRRPRSPATRSSARSSAGSAGRGRSRSGSSPAARRWSLADRRPQRARPRRGAPADGLALGFAQAAALVPGRVAQRRHAGGGALAPLLARAGEPALAHRRAADHRRRHRAQGRAAAPPRDVARAAPLARRRARPPRSPRRSPRSG